MSKDRTLIYRMVHYQNLDGLLTYGIHCSKSDKKIPSYINIGAKVLISKRDIWQVPVEPKGVMSDYVPFYFCPRSPMLLTINSNPLEYQVLQSDIIYLVSSVEKIEEVGLQYVFTDGHFSLKFTEFYNQKGYLSKLDWEVIKAKYWADTEEDNDRSRRKQAEFLVYQTVPFECLGAILVHNQEVKDSIDKVLSKHGKNLYTSIRKDWYYS